MEYDEALKRLGNYYIDRYSIEFPTIFEFCGFKDKTVLEIGAGRYGYFSKEAIKFTKKYMATDISDDMLKELKSRVNVETKACRAENLPFEDNSFDIVFSRWVVQDIDDLDKAIKEMCRVSKENLIIVLPSEEGDETEILKIKYPGKYEYRKNRIVKIKELIFKCGFEVKEIRKSLKFKFPIVEEAIEIFNTLGFKDSLTNEEKERLKEFFLKRKTEEGINFTQGASFIFGYRILP